MPLTPSCGSLSTILATRVTNSRVYAHFWSEYDGLRGPASTRSGVLCRRASSPRRITASIALRSARGPFKSYSFPLVCSNTRAGAREKHNRSACATTCAVVEPPKPALNALTPATSRSCSSDVHSANSESPRQHRAPCGGNALSSLTARVLAASFMTRS
eukprot:7382527-Prymnesium_polylepis.1